MAGSRKPGPLGQNPEVQDLIDGTMIRGLSPLPGPVGVSLMTTHGSLTTAPALTSGVDQLLQRLREASNGIDSQRVAVALLGPQCFSAGVIAGIGVDTGHDSDRIYGPRANALSRLAANGDIFRAGSDIRMADGGLLVSPTGSQRHAQEHASGALVRYQFGALAVIAPP